MSEPWFERRGLVAYKPANAKGTVVLVVMTTAFFGFGAISLCIEDTQPNLAMVSALAAVLSAVVGHFLVFSHIRDRGSSD